VSVDFICNTETKHVEDKINTFKYRLMTGQIIPPSQIIVETYKILNATIGE